MDSVTRKPRQRGLFGLQFRVNFGLTIILGLCFAGLGWFLLSNQWKLLLDDLQRRGEQQAQIVALSCVKHIERGSLYLLEDLVDKAEFSPLVAYCEIRDASGANLLPGDPRVAFNPVDILTVTRDIEGEGGTLGSVTVGMHLGRVRSELRMTTIRMSAAFAAALGLICMLSHLYLNRTVVGPVRDMVHMARNVGDREFGSTKLSGRGDEVGLLAEELNVMSASLRDVYVGLEQTVRERTDKLHQALREVQAVFDNSLVGIAVMNGDGRILRFNRRFAEMFDYESNVLTAMSMADLHSSRVSYAQFEHQFHLTMSRRDVMQLDYQFQRRDGSRIWCQVSAKSIDPADIARGVVWVFEDVTERKRASDALRARAEDLRVAKDDADRAARAKTEFLARMSHEMRTPMNAILGMAQLLAETDLDEEQREFVEMFSSAGDMLLSIINDVLDFSKIEEGHVTLEALPFDLSGVAEEVLRLFQAQAQGKNIEMRLDIAGEIGASYEGDSVRLRQILVNLVGNALKFTHHGSVCLLVDNVDQGGLSMIRFRVRDTGVGIAREHLDIIFDSFVQAETNITRQFGGTGLGLAITKRLVECMGGEISVDSTPGVGTEFTVLLPFKLLNYCLLDQSVGEGGCSRPAPDTMHVLVVDDVEANRRVLSLFLRDEDVNISFARDGHQAVEMMKKTAFDLVFMDVEMPVMNGVEAVRRIRAWEKQEGRPATRIVAMSAHGPDEKKSGLMSEQCMLSLPKPFRKQQVLEIFDYLRDGPRSVTGKKGEQSQSAA